jgi:multiple sugar transport system ATP-binding protein
VSDASGATHSGGIRIERVSRVFDNDVRAVNGVTLDVRPGELMVLVGPSGCGKTTLLRMIAGLDEVTEGRIFLGGQDITRADPQRRDIAMVFQNYALYPHMTVGENLAYALRLRRVPRAERDRRVHAVAATLGIDELLDRRPSALSGGQRQRVAMGRAMVREPQAFLMDEPLSNLDAKLRVAVRAELAQLHERLAVTTVYVTHDQVEAMTLGERVAVMRDGALQQVDRPQTLYRKPANLFVAAFIGSPAMNLVEAEIEGSAVRFGEHALEVGAEAARFDGAPRVVVGIRPSDFRPAAEAPQLPAITVVPELVEDLGAERQVVFPVAAPRLGAAAVLATDDRGGDTVLLADDRLRFTTTLRSRVAVEAGRPLRLAVDPAALHVFDPETGERLS